jgi:hypothetical protein
METAAAGSAQPDRLERAMNLSRTEGRAKSVEAASKTPSDLQSLLTVGGISLAGLGASLLALFGPSGSDLSVALTIVTVAGGLAVVGAGFAIATFAAKR